ncbi:hypothetical protein Tco_1431500 [Tanacetum coccineum]
MVDWLSIVETDKVIHTVETDIVKLVVEIKSFGKSSDEFDKETGSFDGLQLKQADLSCVRALNELQLHEIHVVPRGRNRTYLFPTWVDDSQHPKESLCQQESPLLNCLETTRDFTVLDKTQKTDIANSASTEIANSGIANSATTEIANSDIANSATTEIAISGIANSATTEIANSDIANSATT